MSQNPGFTSLRAWWPLDETGGTRYDAHTGNHDATDVNTCGYIAGKQGNAVEMESASYEWLQISDHDDLSPGNGDWTVAGWVRLESDFSAQQDVWEKEGEWALRYYKASDRFEAVFTAGASETNVQANTFGAISTLTWYFVVIKHDATNNEIGISVNGGAFDTTSFSTSGVDETTNPLHLGYDGNAIATRFDGWQDEVCIYARLLSSDEIDWLYNSGSGEVYGNLQDVTTLTPSALAVSTSLPTATVSAVATLLPSALSVPVTIPTATISVANAPQTVTPSALAVSVTIPAPVVVGGAATLTPAALAVGATLPPPTLSTTVTLSPSALSLAVTIPPPTIPSAVTGFFVEPRSILDYFQVWLMLPDRTGGWLMPQFSSLSLQGHKHGGGTGTVTFVADQHPIVDQLLQANGYGYGLRVYYNDMSNPLYDGVLTHLSAASGPPSRFTELTMTTEAWDQWLLRRRLNMSVNYATVDLLAMPVDNICLEIARAAVGGTTPAGYPVTRSQFHPSGYWTVGVASNHVPGAGVSGNFSEESDNNVLDVLLDLVELYGLGVSWAEFSPGQWLLDIDPFYTTRDFSGDFAISDMQPDVISISREIDYTALANVMRMRGDNKGSAQTYQWVSDGVSVGQYGPFEDAETRSIVTNTAALSDVGNLELTRSAQPIDTWTVRLRDQVGGLAAFNRGFKMRHRITLVSYRLSEPWAVATDDPNKPATPIVTSQDIVGYSLNATGYERPDVDLVIGKPKRNLFSEIRRTVGGRGGRRSGDWRKPNRGG